MPDECENHSKAFACLLFFIVNDGLFKDYVNIPVACINAFFYSLRGIILRLQKEVIGSGLENTF